MSTDILIQKYGEEVVGVIAGLMQGQVTCAVTGRNGAGKTSLIREMVDSIAAYHPLLVHETMKDLELLKKYPSRNIREVENMWDLTNYAKGYVAIIDEVASDSCAFKLMQLLKTPETFALFGNFANSTKDLVSFFRNAFISCSNFNNIPIAEKVVLDTINVDIHLNFTPQFKQYIERITEIVPTAFGYELVDIIRYDIQSDCYYAINRFSYELEAHIKSVNQGVWNKIDSCIRGLR